MTVPRATPWVAEDLIHWSGGLAVAFVTCAGAWWYASVEPLFHEQVPAAVVGVLGTMLAAWCNVLWILRGRRAIGERLRLLLPDPDESASDAPQDGATIPGDAFVAGRDLGRYHDPRCPLAAGRNWKTASGAKHESAGRAPCGVCLGRSLAPPTTDAVK